MYRQYSSNQEHVTARIDVNAIFPKDVSSLRPQDYAQISARLRNWFYENSANHKLEMPHLGFEVGYIHTGVSCRYIPTHSGGPALRFFAKGENAQDAFYDIIKNMCSELFPSIRRQISKMHGHEPRVPQPILPGLENYLPDEADDIRVFESSHPQVKLKRPQLERIIS